MRRRGLARVAVRYALLQVPGTALLISVLYLIQQWAHLSAWIVGCSVALWVAKDVVLFPFVRRAYDSSDADARLGVAARGVAADRLAPSGYVRVGGELWRAETVGGAIEKGAAIRVRTRRGLTLFVDAEGVSDSDS